MELLTIFARTIIVYAFLLIALKLGGKRQIGELQLSELITALMISEIAVSPIVSYKTPIIHAVIPVITVIILEILITVLSTKNQKIKRFIDGTPDVVIKKGKLDIERLGKLRMSAEELIGEGRQAGIADIADVQYAILEENGKFSFFEKAKKGETEKGVAHILVVDGDIDRGGLELAGLTEAQLYAMLKKRGAELSEVFLFTVNDAGDTHLVKKKSSS